MKSTRMSECLGINPKAIRNGFALTLLLLFILNNLLREKSSTKDSDHNGKRNFLESIAFTKDNDHKEKRGFPESIALESKSTGKKDSVMKEGVEEKETKFVSKLSGCLWNLGVCDMILCANAGDATPKNATEQAIEADTASNDIAVSDYEIDEDNLNQGEENIEELMPEKESENEKSPHDVHKGIETNSDYERENESNVINLIVDTNTARRLSRVEETISFESTDMKDNIYIDGLPRQSKLLTRKIIDFTEQPRKDFFTISKQLSMRHGHICKNGKLLSYFNIQDCNMRKLSKLPKNALYDHARFTTFVVFGRIAEDRNLRSISVSDWKGLTISQVFKENGLSTLKQVVDGLTSTIGELGQRCSYSIFLNVDGVLLKLLKFVQAVVPQEIPIYVYSGDETKEAVRYITEKNRKKKGPPLQNKNDDKDMQESKGNTKMESHSFKCLNDGSKHPLLSCIFEMEIGINFLLKKYGGDFELDESKELFEYERKLYSYVQYINNKNADT